jgi:hypothetical protein
MSIMSTISNPLHVRGDCRYYSCLLYNVYTTCMVSTCPTTMQQLTLELWLLFEKLTSAAFGAFIACCGSLWCMHGEGPFQVNEATETLPDSLQTALLMRTDHFFTVVSLLFLKCSELVKHIFRSCSNSL